MIRHSQASFGEKEYDRLSETGKQQSEVLADYFIQKGTHFDSIYTGPKIRHKDTAMPLMEKIRGKNLPAPKWMEIPEFDEFDYKNILICLIPKVVEEEPELEKKWPMMFQDVKAFKEIFTRAVLLWIQGKHDNGDYESFPDFCARIRKGLLQIQKNEGRGKQIGLFTSSGAISFCIAELLGLEHDKTAEINHQIVNASITRFKFTRERISLFSLNETQHLEKNGTRFITYR